MVLSRSADLETTSHLLHYPAVIEKWKLSKLNHQISVGDDIYSVIERWLNLSGANADIFEYGFYDPLESVEEQM